MLFLFAVGLVLVGEGDIEPGVKWFAPVKIGLSQPGLSQWVGEEDTVPIYLPCLEEVEQVGEKREIVQLKLSDHRVQSSTLLS